MSRIVRFTYLNTKPELIAIYPSVIRVDREQKADLNYQEHKIVLIGQHLLQQDLVVKIDDEIVSDDNWQLLNSNQIQFSLSFTKVN